MLDERTALLEALRAAAERAVEEVRWEDAGQAWQRLAELEEALGNARPAMDSWDSAGESWRKADNPELALAALEQADSWLGAPTLQQGLRACRKAAVLSDLGRYRDAESALRRAEKTLGPHPLVVDTRIELARTYARKERWRPWVDELVGPARSWRLALLARDDGQLANARAHLQPLLGLALGDASLMVRILLAELMDLEGDVQAAVAALEEARGDLLAKGRQGIAASVMAKASLMLTDQGVEVLPHRLVEAFEYCRSRGLRLLRLEVGAALAASLAVREPQQAQRLTADLLADAMALGVRRRAGRLRWLLARLSPESRRVQYAQAQRLLADDVPLLERMRRELGPAPKEGQP